MLEFIICFIIVVWLFGGLLPWIFEHWAQALGVAAIVATLYKITGGAIV